MDDEDVIFGVIREFRADFCALKSRFSLSRRNMVSVFELTYFYTYLQYTIYIGRFYSDKL